MGVEEHRRSAAAIRARCAIITLSDSRTAQNDESGAVMRRLLSDAGHELVSYHLIPNDPAQLAELLAELEGRQDVDLILTSGGTGISRADQTIGVVERRLNILLPGFGELFRRASEAQIGAAAMLTRATAGVTDGKLLFAMPGSPAAVELALSKLILPELPHLIREVRR